MIMTVAEDCPDRQGHLFPMGKAREHTYCRQLNVEWCWLLLVKYAEKEILEIFAFDRTWRQLGHSMLW